MSRYRSVTESWLLFAFLSAVFAGLTSILAKIGIRDIDSDLGTAIRTIVVLIMAWFIVLIVGSFDTISDIPANSLVFLVLSGFATGASWLCFYHALQTGPASVIVPVDKLSILFTVLFAFFILGERPSKRSWIGLVLLVAGTLLMMVRSVPVRSPVVTASGEGHVSINSIQPR